MWGIGINPGLQFLASPLLNSSNSRRGFKKPTTLKLLRASISETGFPLGSRIVVRNLRYSVTESCLQKEFSNFGEIADVKLFKGESNPKSSKVSAFIQYSSQDDAILALENMDQTLFDGRLICVELARPVKASSAGFPRTCGPPVKQQLQVMQEDEVADCWY
nr:chloroplast RRM domain-containing protein [Passiflora contracta]